MVFSSFTFLFLFLPTILFFYYIIPKEKIAYKNLILLIFSLIFYAWGEPIYIVLMLISIISNYILALLINKYKNNKIKAKIFLILSILISIGLLGFFKYADFLIVNLNYLLGLNLSLLNIPLPIGISFYTFQIMSYTIDVYRNKVAVQKNFLALATYVALFPQLIAGPIVRYITIEDELKHRKVTVSMFADGIRRFIIGLAKKVVIANNVALFADAVFNNNPSQFGTLAVWMAAIAYTFQVYFDFSGYSDMAIGLGKMFGFNFLENFNYPYIARSMGEFWRRWHISLGTWFRDYVYIPLGGSRVSLFRWIINMFIVWSITGLWHGASWNFVLWGLYAAVFMVMEKLFLNKLLEKIPRLLQHLYAIFLIIIGRVLFRVDNVTNLFKYLSRMFTYKETNILSFFTVNDNLMHLFPYFILAAIGCTPLIKNLLNKMDNSKKQFFKYLYDFYLIAILIISIMHLVNSSFNPFIYFRF